MFTMKKDKNRKSNNSAPSAAIFLGTIFLAQSLVLVVGYWLCSVYGNTADFFAVSFGAILGAINLFIWAFITKLVLGITDEGESQARPLLAGAVVFFKIPLILGILFIVRDQKPLEIVLGLSGFTALNLGTGFLLVLFGNKS